MINQPDTESILRVLADNQGQIRAPSFTGPQLPQNSLRPTLGAIFNPGQAPTPNTGFNSAFANPQPPLSEFIQKLRSGQTSVPQVTPIGNIGKPVNQISSIVREHFNRTNGGYSPTPVSSTPFSATFQHTGQRGSAFRLRLG